MNPEHYHLEFFDDDGHMPVLAWLDQLEKDDPAKHDALVYALQVILARQGPNVCDTEFGKNLGKGLYEFRLRHTRAEIQARAEPRKKAPATAGAPPNVLFRVFFAVQGDKILLLLGGYDKGTDPTPKRQQKEIKSAQARLRQHLARQKADAKRARRVNHGTVIGSPAEVPADERVAPDRSFLIWSRRRRRRRS